MAKTILIFAGAFSQSLLQIHKNKIMKKKKNFNSLICTPFRLPMQYRPSHAKFLGIISFMFFFLYFFYVHTLV